MNGLTPISKSARLREDAYASEIDQILLNNLREAIALQQEAAAATACSDQQECEHSGHCDTCCPNSTSNLETLHA